MQRATEQNVMAAITGLCLLALLVIALLWIAGLSLRTMAPVWFSSGPVYPDPPCETCGALLDARHRVCAGPEGDDLDTRGGRAHGGRER